MKIILNSGYLHSNFESVNKIPEDILKSLSHIAYAENDEDDQFMFAEALKRFDPAVKLSVFDHCKLLLDELHHNPSFLPDLIYLDLNMPGNKDFECLREIRKSRYRSIPVIIYSTTDVNSVIQTAYEYGATRFIVKPLSFTAIKDGIAGIIELYNNDRLQPETR